MSEHVIQIDQSGRVTFIYSDDLEPLLAVGDAEVRRASHVEPCAGGWAADLGPCSGGVLGPYRLRGDALAAERAWLEGQLQIGMI